jgi:hypothetical protein
MADADRATVEFQFLKTIDMLFPTTSALARVTDFRLDIAEPKPNGMFVLRQHRPFADRRLWNIALTERFPLLWNLRPHEHRISISRIGRSNRIPASRDKVGRGSLANLSGSQSHLKRFARSMPMTVMASIRGYFNATLFQ